MQIVVVGTGYVGLVTGACFAEVGNRVVCVDVDQRKVAMLRAGEIPIHEPGLDVLVRRNLAEKRLSFAASIAEALAALPSCPAPLLAFIAVGTPPGEDGSADLTHVLAAARDIGRAADRPFAVIGKSTVPVGTARKVEAAIRAELEARGADPAFHVISNPEFLKEGAAIDDFMRPDRVVVGCRDEAAEALMRDLYAPFFRKNDRVLVMGVEEAEMTKYAANAMLATKISFINEIAALCDRLGVDVEQVREGIGADSRIGYAFIYPGIGYGGSCFPKDVGALVRIAEAAGVAPLVLSAVEARNRAQKSFLAGKIKAFFGEDLRGVTIAVWGLSFKPGTDDLREAPSRVVIGEILAAGGRVRAYDPVAMENARAELDPAWFATGALELAPTRYDAADGADALALLTEWKVFRAPDLGELARRMKRKVVFDGRNQYAPQKLRDAGFEYFGVGR
ncbi:MAG: UDP-glucose/GDP-mannose dehydrogenase family protein [Proteobacteria bacterium]|jgi:UDPglucose 6-dehydrogenase|nr:UDP-glucose/GDP-mannose dehydrogenase family protein [Pseudomonadota bacterium]